MSGVKNYKLQITVLIYTLVILRILPVSIVDIGRLRSSVSQAKLIIFPVLVYDSFISSFTGL